MTTRSIARCGVCIALFACSAWFTVPLGPIPFTMQTFVLALLPQVLGTRDAFFTVVVYLLLGAVGVPV
ncbi:TPA: biotin transporter BioY, partial [Clostridioides difficile]|nr:biotin transporter BioY [Clostridioides difficile]